jgi:hypothetical protein
VLVLWNTDLAQSDIHHVYLRGASLLRPDLLGGIGAGARVASTLHEGPTDEGGHRWSS